MGYEELLAKIDGLKGQDLCEFVSKVRDWALMHGIGLRSKSQFSEDKLEVLRLSLLPNPIDQDSFNKAMSIQPMINYLYHRLAYDEEFLESALYKTIEYDEFTRRLFEIYTIVKKEGISQSISLGLFRSDYLAHSDTSLRQVEMNTIASSMSGLISRVEILHRYVLKELGLDNHLMHLPENNALVKLCNGLLEAWRIYNVPSSAILFLVEEVTYNICDQRFMEFQLSNFDEKPRIIRRSFSQLLKSATLGDSRELMVDGIEVAVVYFRCGYDPVHYTNERCWDMRLLLERSKALKCPSIQYHLVGTKKVQQVICDLAILEKYLPDKETAKLIKDMFVDMYPLDQSEKGDVGYQLALSQPEKFVLKPQREGGGHNIYASEIPKYLSGLSREEASAFILMHLIQTKPNKSILLNQGEVIRSEVVSELGVYGIIIGNEKEIYVNEVGGHMLRSKLSSSNEAGVAAGFGFLDSPYLV